MPERLELRDVEMDVDNVLRHVSLKYATRRGLRRIQKLRYPGSKDLLSKDPVRAKRAAKKLAQSYLAPKRTLKTSVVPTS